MKTLFLRIIPLIAFFNAFSLGAQSFEIKKNLESEWLTFDGNKFTPFDESDDKVKVLYLKLKNPDPRGEYLRVTANDPVHLFANNKLAGEFTSFNLNIDSLARKYGADELLIAVYFGEQSREDISTELLSSSNLAIKDSLEKRHSFFFKDFVFVGALILLVMVAVMIRVNPKLATDYFSIPRIFSFREMEDAQVYTRIGSSTNILFYVYCSLLLGFYLLIIFHFVTPVYPVGQAYEAQSFGGAFFQWLKISSLLLGLLFLKIIMVIGFSSLFGIAEVAGIHFFNWVRLIVVFFGLLTLALLIYFIWYGQNVSILSFMLQLLAWITAGWILLIFLKLGSKSGASMFHLFSYICATELIPFLFIIKVLYN
jgi:hypothetical protein